MRTAFFFCFIACKYAGLKTIETRHNGDMHKGIS